MAEVCIRAHHATNTPPSDSTCHRSSGWVPPERQPEETSLANTGKHSTPRSMHAPPTALIGGEEDGNGNDLPATYLRWLPYPPKSSIPGADAVAWSETTVAQPPVLRCAPPVGQVISTRSFLKETVSLIAVPSLISNARSWSLRDARRY